MGENNFNIVEVKISDKNKKKVEKRFEFSTAQFKLTDKLIKGIMQENEISDLISCTLTVGGYNVALLILDYSLTSTVSIDGFYDIPSAISLLQVQNVDVSIVKQKIDKLQMDGSSIMLAECQVNQFDVGLRKFSLEEESCFEFKNIDIRDCTIHFMQMYHNCINFNIQQSNIDILDMKGSMRPNAAIMKVMSVWQNSNIDTISIGYTIESFRIKESTISKMIAKGGCYFENANIEFASVFDAYNFTKENFSQLDVGEWSVIAKSTFNQGAFDKRAEAQYHIVKKAYKKEKGIRGFFGKLIDFCTGYGYKPIRALRACVLMILFSWGILECVDITLLRLRCIIPVRSIWDNLFISITAVIGQSGLKISDGFPYWVAYMEYIGAVILFAMFVNALYVRYKD